MNVFPMGHLRVDIGLEAKGKSEETPSYRSTRSLNESARKERVATDYSHVTFMPDLRPTSSSHNFFCFRRARKKSRDSFESLESI